MIREFVKDTKKVAENIDTMFEQAAYDNKTITAHFFIGKKEAAIDSHLLVDPLNIEVSENIITVSCSDGSIHHIDISQFDCIKCDNECVDDVADAPIDMMCDQCSVHFDILTI